MASPAPFPGATEGKLQVFDLPRLSVFWISMAHKANVMLLVWWFGSAFAFHVHFILNKYIKAKFWSIPPIFSIYWRQNWIAMPHFSSISQNCHPRKARLPKSKSGGESEVEWLRNLRIVRIAGWCAKTNDELINLRPLSQCIIAVTSLNCPQRRLFRFSETKNLLFGRLVTLGYLNIL